MIRAQAGLEYALMEAMANGHCDLVEDELLFRQKNCLKFLRHTSRSVAGGVGKRRGSGRPDRHAPLYFSRLSLAR